MVFKILIRTFHFGQVVVCVPATSAYCLPVWAVCWQDVVSAQRFQASAVAPVGDERDVLVEHDFSLLSSLFDCLVNTLNNAVRIPIIAHPFVCLDARAMTSLNKLHAVLKKSICEYK